MTGNEVLMKRLRGIRRGYKCGILLTAAWAPLFLGDHPLMAGFLMASMTAIFFLATGSPRDSAANSTQPGNIDVPS
jgi:hypothetical protein